MHDANDAWRYATTAQIDFCAASMLNKMQTYTAQLGCGSD